MSQARRLYLRIALVAFGLIFIFAVYPLTMLWPSGWAWGHEHSHYLTITVVMPAACRAATLFERTRERRGWPGQARP